MGGTACIFACQCARLGLATAGIGVAGRDLFGELAIQKLKECGVDITSVRIFESLKTGLGIALCKGNDRAILTYIGTIDAVKHRFFNTVNILKSKGYLTGKLHIQASYGILNYSDLPCDYARAGIILYEVLSSNDKTLKEIWPECKLHIFLLVEGR